MLSREKLLKFARTAALATLVLAVAASFPYACTSRYELPPAAPFAGPGIYNPYENLSGRWLKGNFQVSAKAWGGLTDGKDSVEAVFGQYRKFGYDVIAVTDYQKVGRYLPEGISNVTAYEHGFNLRKRHHVCLEPRSVLWYDLPFYQSGQHKQHLIELLRPECGLLALAHPALLGAFTRRDMNSLAGYHAMEVLNYHKFAFELWDAALSAGRPVWLLASDDAHDVTDLKTTMRCWTMIDAPSAAEDDVVAALKAGRAYGVIGRNAVDENRLLSVVVEGEKVTVTLEKVAGEIKFIGQGGRMRAVFGMTRSASASFAPEDTYFRVEASMPHSLLVLNPVMRTGGGMPEIPSAVPDPVSTGIMRLCFTAFYAAVAALFAGLLLKRRRRN